MPMNTPTAITILPARRISTLEGCDHCEQAALYSLYWQEPVGDGMTCVCSTCLPYSVELADRLRADDTDVRVERVICRKPITASAHALRPVMLAAAA